MGAALSCRREEGDHSQHSSSSSSPQKTDGWGRETVPEGGYADFKALRLEKGKESIHLKASVAEARENGKEAERQVDRLVPVGS